MADGVDVTDQGVKFLLALDSAEALKQLRTFQDSAQSMAAQIERSIGQAQKMFNTTFDSIGDIAKKLDENPQLALPGLASPKSEQASSRIQRQIENARKDLETGLDNVRSGMKNINSETQNLTTSLDRAGQEAKGLKDQLGNTVGMSISLKKALATVGAAFGAQAITESALDLSETLEKLAIRTEGLGVSFENLRRSSFEVSKMTKTLAVEDTALLIKQLYEVGVTSQTTQASMISLADKASQAFGSSREAVVGYLAEISKRGLILERDIEGYMSSLSALQDLRFGPGNMEQDIQLLTSLRREMENIASIAQTRFGQTEEAAGRATQRLAAQLTVMSRQVNQFGGEMGAEIAAAVSRIPELLTTPAGAQFRAILAQGAGVDPETMIRQIAEGSLETVADGIQSLTRLSEEALSAALPGEYLSRLTGGQISDPKAFIEIIRNMNSEMGKAGRSLGDAMRQAGEVYDQQMALPEALNAAYEKAMGTLSGSFTRLQTVLTNITAELSVIASGPLSLMIDTFNIALERVQKVLGVFREFRESAGELGKVIDAALVGALTYGVFKATGAMRSLASTIRSDVGGALAQTTAQAKQLELALGGATAGGAAAGAGRAGGALGRARGAIGRAVGGSAGAVAGVATGAFALSEIASSTEGYTSGQKLAMGAGALGGTALGGIAGSLLGGPVGAIIGTQIGAAAGESIAKYFAGAPSPQAAAQAMSDAEALRIAQERFGTDAVARSQVRGAFDLRQDLSELRAAAERGDSADPFLASLGLGSEFKGLSARELLKAVANEAREDQAEYLDRVDQARGRSRRDLLTRGPQYDVQDLTVEALKDIAAGKGNDAVVEKLEKLLEKEDSLFELLKDRLGFNNDISSENPATIMARAGNRNPRSLYTTR